MIKVDRSLFNSVGLFHKEDVNFSQLRQERLKKVQNELQSRQIGALLVTDVANIRYTTGVSVMPLWTAINYARYAVIPCEGEPVLFEYPEAQFIAKKILEDVRPTCYWQYRFSGSAVNDQSKKWADEIYSVLKEKGLEKSKLAIDNLDYYGHKALADLGIEICDADEPIASSRMIKLPAEVELMKQSASVCETALYAFEKAIEPGISENELLGIFWQTMLKHGGDWCFTRLIASGSRTNPWFQEAGTKVVRPGDLVAIDTDMIGPHGFACDISRTFLCGDVATDDQKDAYKVAIDFVDELCELAQPGLSYGELAKKLPKVPAKYMEQRYPVFLHGIGTDDEPPFWPFPDMGDTTHKQNEHLKVGMVLAIEFYAGEVGKQDGVKYEDQIYLSEDGPVLMTLYPKENKLL